MEEKRLRLQTAVEFISTYGWAILVTLAVLVVIVLYGILGPSSRVGSTCVFPAGFACSQAVLATSGALFFNISDNIGHPVNITGVACDANQSVKHATLLANPVYVSSGGNVTFIVQCYTGTTGAFSGGIGSIYSGYLIVNYTDLLTSTQYTTVGSVEAKASVNSLSISPFITFSQNPIGVNAVLTITSLCQGSDQCAVDRPLSTHLCQVASTCSNSVTIAAVGTYTYYANDLTNHLITTGNIVVTSTTTSSTTTTICSNSLTITTSYSQSAPDSATVSYQAWGGGGGGGLIGLGGSGGMGPTISPNPYSGSFSVTAGQTVTVDVGGGGGGANVGGGGGGSGYYGGGGGGSDPTGGGGGGGGSSVILVAGNVVGFGNGGGGGGGVSGSTGGGGGTQLTFGSGGTGVNGATNGIAGASLAGGLGGNYLYPAFIGGSGGNGANGGNGGVSGQGGGGGGGYGSGGGSAGGGAGGNGGSNGNPGNSGGQGIQGTGGNFGQPGAGGNGGSGGNGGLVILSWSYSAQTCPI